MAKNGFHVPESIGTTDEVMHLNFEVELDTDLVTIFAGEKMVATIESLKWDELRVQGYANIPNNF